MGEPSNSFKYAKLSLDEPRDVYYSGQLLTGHIVCELAQPLNYSAININFLGEGKVFWTEYEIEEYNGVRRQVNVKYSANETYFNTMLCVSGGSGVVSLKAGLHRVPFQFQIPHNAPSSFTGEKGSVTYKVVAYIEYPDPTMDRDQLEKAFEVVAPLDLNIGNDFKQPVNIEFEEVFTCCCRSSSMALRIHMPATGFCPGQTIPISIIAENESNVEIKKIIFELIQKECYHSIQPKSDYIPPAQILETVQTGAILANTKREVTYKLTVPDMIAPNLQNCNIIDVGYFINVTVKLSGCAKDLEDESEICLGLVPLSSLVQNYEHPMQSDLPQGPIPDPSYIAPQVHLPMETMTPIQNTTAFPTASPYPGGSFPLVTPYPQNANHGIPMSNLPKDGIGFVVPTTPSIPPYPGVNQPPYPGVNQPTYPGANTSPYPGANASPYPGANASPYPGANNSPYPANQPGYPAQPFPAYSAPSAPPS